VYSYAREEDEKIFDEQIFYFKFYFKLLKFYFHYYGDKRKIKIKEKVN